MTTTQQHIEARLTTHLQPTYLLVEDVSAAHRGHAAALANPGKGHFQVEIVAARFVGMSAVQRHQAVYQALGDLMTTSIHALSIKADVPAVETTHQYKDE